MITKWSTECDRRLHRLICYIHSSLDVKMVSYVGESFGSPIAYGTVHKTPIVASPPPQGAGRSLMPPQGAKRNALERHEESCLPANQGPESTPQGSVFPSNGQDGPGVRTYLYADSDFAGCKKSMRSTSGTYTAYKGPRTHCGLSAQSKKHDATSHATAEAEIVALDLVVRRDGLPLLQLNDKLFGDIEMFVEEDNQPAIVIVTKAKLSTFRQLNRTRKVNVFSCTKRSSVNR